MDFIYKHKNKLFILASILILIPFLFNIGLGEDEPFTMGIIRHNYSEIVNLTAMDVHPPLYYFILKIFLTITTFWTTNIFTKIIFARLLSVIISLITFFYLHKILILLKANFNIYLEWLLFLILPLEVGLSPQITNLRMYSLSIMLFSLVVYNTIKLENSKSSKYLLGIYTCATLSLYNNYYGGLIVGIFLGCYTIFNFLCKSWKKGLQIILMGALSIISFIPWVPYLLSQSTKLPNHSLASTISRYILEVIIIVFIFGMPLILAILKHKENKLILITILSTLLIAFIASLKLSHIMYSTKYLSSIFVPFEFVGIGFFIKNCKNYKNIIRTIISLCICLFIGSCLFISGYRQIKSFTLPSITFIHKFNEIKESNHKNINIRKANLNTYVWDSQGGNSIYLLSINKNISDNNYLTTNNMLGSGNPKLFHSIFPNIKHYVIQGRQR